MKFELDQQQVEVEKNVEIELFKLIEKSESFYFISGKHMLSLQVLINL